MAKKNATVNLFVYGTLRREERQRITPTDLTSLHSGGMHSWKPERFLTMLPSSDSQPLPGGCLMWDDTPE